MPPLDELELLELELLDELELLEEELLDELELLEELELLDEELLELPLSLGESEFGDPPQAARETDISTGKPQRTKGCWVIAIIIGPEAIVRDIFLKSYKYTLSTAKFCAPDQHIG